jgi:anthranilate phosphoribosyltransferase
MSLRESTRDFVGALLDGTLDEQDAIARLAGIDMDALTAEQLAGAAEAVMARAVPFPAFPDALDCCGTGGDGQHSFNISTTAALVVAACGVTVAKHGNRAITSSSGSADVLEALGVITQLTPEQTERVLRETGIAFLFAPTFHPGFKRVAPIRKAVGKRTIFNLLGPLCNPARVERQLIGVFAEPYCQLVAETAQLLGHRHVLVAYGMDGGDEISVTGPTHIAELKANTVQHHRWNPHDAGLPIRLSTELKGGNAMQNADALHAVLCGAPGAYADAVALNAAAVLVLAGKAATLYDGVQMAKATLLQGDALRVLDNLIEATHSV